MARAKQPKPVHQLTLAQFEEMFPHEDACRIYLANRRWPEGTTCPRCGSEKVTPHSTMPHYWQCYACDTNGYRFSVLVGTIFENTNVPLKTWFRVIHMMLTSKKGVSALQVHRTIGTGSYRTAWYMCHRIRLGLSEPAQKLAGTVEVDETFIGGKASNRHTNKRGRDNDGNPRGGAGGIGSGKAPVAGALSRKGKLVAQMVANVSTKTLDAFVRRVVDPKVSTIITDDYVAYRYLSRSFPHHVINHSKGQYVVGAIHTNTIEGFWSIFKRGIVGSFHKVSKKYLSQYVAEFQFRYNNRMNADIFGTAIKGC